MTETIDTLTREAKMERLISYAVQRGFGGFEPMDYRQSDGKLQWSDLEVLFMPSLDGHKAFLHAIYGDDFLNFGSMRSEKWIFKATWLATMAVQGRDIVDCLYNDVFSSHSLQKRI